MNKRGRLLVISGPSGVGKTTVARELAERAPLVRVVTCTTRPPRPGERHGRDYHFLSREEFARGIEEGRFLEFAEVHGQFYGTPRNQVEEALDAGEDVLLSIDVQGARQVREAGIPELTTVFLEPPDLGELERRLRGRSTDSPEEIQRRLAVASREMEEKERYDHVITNGVIGDTVRQIESILAGAEQNQ